VSPHPTIHGSAVLLGAKAILIRGPSGSGKSRLALALIESLPAPWQFARLVADDRVSANPTSGRLVLSVPPELAGLIEVRGLGIRQVPYEPLAVAGLVVDFVGGVPRLPDADALETEVVGVKLPRLAVPSGSDAFPLLLAYMTSRAADLTTVPVQAYGPGLRMIGKR